MILNRPADLERLIQIWKSALVIAAFQMEAAQVPKRAGNRLLLVRFSVDLQGAFEMIAGLLPLTKLGIRFGQIVKRIRLAGGVTYCSPVSERFVMKLDSTGIIA